jgi:predicted nucleotidyltransferase/uncharacterized protein (UPF0332 family)
MTESNVPKNLNQELNNHTKYVKPTENQEFSGKVKKDLESKKQEFDKVKNFVTKKYKFTLAIGILPPQSIPKIEAEEPIPENEKNQKRTHIVIIIPEEQFKNIKKIKNEIVDFTKKIKEKIWIHVITPVDIWNFLEDSRYDLSSAIAMSYPIYDKGLLGALRVTEIHKNLILKRFERYVSSYVIAGSLVRGTATKTSDIDVFIIIDDTDVKRMPRIELREKLRGIIYKYISEAQAIAGTKNKLEPQIYLLTNFWESVKDAHPVMFTFIRDGIPLYDRGTFVPWKLLLKMGKIKPSPEAIDMFMSMGDKTESMAKRRLLALLVNDIYWGVITPSQALLMLNGLPPPVPKDTAKIFRETFVTKEKVLDKKYADILQKVIKLYKDYEHGKLKEISGAEIDTLLKETKDYIEQMKKLRVKVEKINTKNTIKEVHDEVIDLLKKILGNKSKQKLFQDFEKELIKKGKMPKSTLKSLRLIDKVYEETKKSKKDLKNQRKVEEARKEARVLIDYLIEYGQRCELAIIDKHRMKIKTKKGEIFELLIKNKKAFLIKGNEVKKITDKIENSSVEELNKEVETAKENQTINLDPKIFEIIEKQYGDFDIQI